MKENFSIDEAVSNLWDKLDGWFDAIILKLPNFALAIVIMIAFWFIAKLTSKFTKKFLLKKVRQQSVREMMGKILFGITLLVGFFIALGVMELDKALTSILAGAGVMGLAIGLALQGTLGNTVSGVVLSFQPNVRIGDFIETEGKQGYITEISLRNIVMRQTDNEFVIIPNSKFVENVFTNYSWSQRSRISVSCGVGYESNLQQVEDLVVGVISENFEQKDKEEVEFFFTGFGDSSINFITRFWIESTQPKHKLAATHKAIKLIKKSFNKENINIPFPIRTLDFGKNSLQIVSEKE
ncbi:small conductance mechanosensitive channel [Ulvibacter sp. MAR_2010_11]|uniref:mechanosensitive ion channel family protein n=1 Tax=Ulvibacter sp. MAR_2010_11 TaxID=1250229 RepID=UPI000C2CCDE4|nr:mechanosensitive ion channel family protein [Ulvibacter sp. MAR_2010_11]PKA84129.1 small conductance mechanosensitive channel [Ulvibacter sp. MAR_2010_11]